VVLYYGDPVHPPYPSLYPGDPGMSIVTRIDLLIKRRTKIIATIGPASSHPDKIRQLIQAGVNIFRLNMSHGDHSFHSTAFNHIDGIRRDLDEPIAVLADLCGPKIRTGKFRDGGIELLEGQNVTVTMRNVIGEDGLIPSQYPALSNDVSEGDRILLSDGTMELRVNGVQGTEVSCTVIHGGRLQDNKGINLPGVRVSAPSLTGKDAADAAFALQLGVDYIALSFVRQAADILELKQLVNTSGYQAGIIAKIEKAEALHDIDAILDSADGIMVARGDLGVELNPEEVPVAQGQLIALARSRFKPVIVATQMLESMIENIRPTRAEITDISYAVTLGTDAVMLSAESASGRYPLESVRMMDRAIRQTEAYLWKTGTYGNPGISGQSSSSHLWKSIADASAFMSKNLNAHAILVISHSGMSAATMSSARPAAPILAITNSPDVCRRMALHWGVVPLVSEDTGLVNPNILARETALKLGLATTGQHILLVRGFHNDPDLNTPSITVLTV